MEDGQFADLMNAIDEAKEEIVAGRNVRLRAQMAATILAGMFAYEGKCGDENFMAMDAVRYTDALLRELGR